MKKLFLGCGEVLWDLLPTGRQLGGAPVNAACHAHALGADARPISRVGNDASGREILERLRALELPTECVTVDDSAPTGTASVELTDGQPNFVIHENVAWDRIKADETATSWARRADAICFGTLAQRSEPARGCVRELVAATPYQALRIFDVNLRQHFYSREIIEASLRLANVVKLNEQELPVLAGLIGLSGAIETQLREMKRRYELHAAALTRGARGSVLCVENDCSEHPGLKVRVIDTVGAGDAFTAAMAMGLLRRWNAEKINRHANEIAADVATQTGATPKLPAHLTAPFTDATD